MIVMMAGLPGTGKSTLARALAARVGGKVLDKDVIRATLFSPKLIVYSTKQDDLVVQQMLDEAHSILRIHPDQVVILDGRPFSKKYQVDAVVNFAKQIKTPWRIIECVCPEPLALQRIETDATHVARNRDAKLYHGVKAHFQPIRRRKLVLDTSASLTANLDQMERHLSA